MEKTSLFDLIEHYGSDKNLSSYTDVYKVIFAPFRDKIVDVLEIGIGTLMPEIPSTFIGNPRLYPHYTPGGSLRVWRDYFEKGNIYGGDVAPDCMIHEERIRTFLFDSTDRAACDASLGGLQFDLIVDDGLHEQEAQLATLKNLYHRLRPGGIYVIEDILRPDVFDELHPEIRSFIGNADLSRNNRGNMRYIKKYE